MSPGKASCLNHGGRVPLRCGVGVRCSSSTQRHPTTGLGPSCGMAAVGLWCFSTTCQASSCAFVSLDEKSPGQGASDSWQRLHSLLCAPPLASPDTGDRWSPFPLGVLGRGVSDGFMENRPKLVQQTLCSACTGTAPCHRLCSSQSFPPLPAPIGQALSALDYLSRRTWPQAPHSFQPSAALSPRQALRAAAITRGSG